METYTCPHCHAKVNVGDDGICPRCSATILYQQNPSPFAAAVRTSAFPRSSTPDLAADRENPYEAPQHVEAGNGFDDFLIRDSLAIAFSFVGRIPRRIYWVGWSANWGWFLPYLFMVVYLLDDSLLRRALILASYLPFFYIALALMVKRWHDRNKSGWWVFIYFVPVIGPLWLLLETGFGAGTFGPNEYGPASI